MASGCILRTYVAPRPLVRDGGVSMSPKSVQSRTKKVAAALAAVESYLAEEHAGSAAVALAAGDSSARARTSPWALAGRLALMNARMGAAPRGRGAR